MRRLLLALMALTVTAGLTAGGFLAVTAHHSRPANRSQAPGNQPLASARPSLAACRDHAPSRPFTGVAINPPIAAQAGSFATAAGTHLGMVEFYAAFGKHFPQHEAQQAADLGALPLIQLNPRHASLASISAGKWDSHLRHYAAAVKAFRCPVALSFGHEMNGWWYPWGSPHSSPAEFIAAWRRIHGIFTAEHVTNVIWSWDPDHTGSKASKWWPGAAFVDWIGIDGYQRSGETFRSVFSWQLANIRSFSSKPVFIAETAVAPGAHQKKQIAGLFAALKKYRLAGLVWFDINRKEPWRLEGRPAAIAAFRAGMRLLP